MASVYILGVCSVSAPNKVSSKIILPNFLLLRFWNESCVRLVTRTWTHARVLSDHIIQAQAQHAAAASSVAPVPGIQNREDATARKWSMIDLQVLCIITLAPIIAGFETTHCSFTKLNS